MALIGAAPAGAATQGEQAVVAASSAAPSCVKSTFYADTFFGVLHTEMTNNCSSVQRVKPSFDPGFTGIPCFELSPGEKAVHNKSVIGIYADRYKFLGLVTC
jgi:hypothetical protein